MKKSTLIIMCFTLYFNHNSHAGPAYNNPYIAILEIFIKNEKRLTDMLWNNYSIKSSSITRKDIASVRLERTPGSLSLVKHFKPEHHISATESRFTVMKSGRVYLDKNETFFKDGSVSSISTFSNRRTMDITHWNSNVKDDFSYIFLRLPDDLPGEIINVAPYIRSENRLAVEVNNQGVITEYILKVDDVYLQPRGFQQTAQVVGFTRLPASRLRHYDVVEDIARSEASTSATPAVIKRNTDTAN